MDITPRFENNQVFDDNPDILVNFNMNKFIDKYFIDNIDLFERIIRVFSDNYMLLSKLFKLCKNIPYLFYLIVNKEKYPDLRTREDTSIITIFIRICLNYLYRLPTFQPHTKIKNMFHLEFPDEINAICHYMDQSLRLKGYSNSYNIAVTSILVLRGICPKLVIYSLETSKELMKIAGVSTLNILDVPKDVEVDNPKKHVKPKLKRMKRVHMCTECKNWVCEPCSRANNDLHVAPHKTMSLKNIKNPFSLKLNLNDIKAESSSSNSPRTTKTPKHNDIPSEYMISKYDRFCRDIVIKGHKYTVSPYTPKECNILFSGDEIDILKQNWYKFSDNNIQFAKYGSILQHIIGTNTADQDFYYWDSLFTYNDRIILLDNIDKYIYNLVILIDENGETKFTKDSLTKFITKWKHTYNELLK